MSTDESPDVRLRNRSAPIDAEFTTVSEGSDQSVSTVSADEATLEALYALFAEMDAREALEARAATPFHALPLIVSEEEAFALDVSQAREHIVAIEPRAEDPSFPMHFRTDDDKGSKSKELQRYTDVSLSDVANDVGFDETIPWENNEGEIHPWHVTKPGYLTMQSRGANLCVTVNETKGDHRRRNRDIVAYRAVWCEDDNDNEEGKSFDERIRRFPLRPSLIVQSSPGKFHFYWPFKESWPAPRKRRNCGAAFKRGSFDDYGGDEAAMDPARVLRLAGSLHLKREPWRVPIIENNGTRFSMAELAQAFKPVLREPKPQGAVAITDDPDLLRYELSEVTDALFYIPAAAGIVDKKKTYRLWTTDTAAALRSFFGDPAFPLWHAWSYGEKGLAPYPGWDACWAKWTTFADRGSARAGITTIKTIYWQARKNGWKTPGAPRLWNYTPPVIPIEGTSRIVLPALAPPASEAAAAR